MWIFHGEKDPTAPVERSKEMAAALEKAGAHPEADALPRGGARLMDGGVRESGADEWMLAQRRVDPPPMPKRK
ncbi:hypothetical protein AYO47_09100 [Planctomyces sp. SCGC AG-212-M04]|nr:hypothetical protein AYO47_09100 [Planctomyces sp. SCGC AG-212-M04]